MTHGLMNEENCHAESAIKIIRVYILVKPDLLNQVPCPLPAGIDGRCPDGKD